MPAWCWQRQSCSTMVEGTVRRARRVDKWVANRVAGRTVRAPKTRRREALRRSRREVTVENAQRRVVIWWWGTTRRIDIVCHRCNRPSRRRRFCRRTTWTSTVQGPIVLCAKLRTSRNRWIQAPRHRRARGRWCESRELTWRGHRWRRCRRYRWPPPSDRVREIYLRTDTWVDEWVKLDYNITRLCLQFFVFISYRVNF